MNDFQNKISKRMNIGMFNSQSENIIIHALTVLLEQSGRYDHVHQYNIDNLSSMKDDPIDILFYLVEKNIEHIMKDVNIIRLSNPSLPILVMTYPVFIEKDIKRIVAFEKIGIVTPDTSEDELHLFINQLSNGSSRWLLGNGIQDILIDQIISQDTITQGNANFNKTEQKILQLFTQGYDIKQTAVELNLSRNTIAVYRGRMLRKAGARSMNQLLL